MLNSFSGKGYAGINAGKGKGQVVEFNNNLGADLDPLGYANFSAQDDFKNKKNGK
jgi:hypothetical protein